LHFSPSGHRLIADEVQRTLGLVGLGPEQPIAVHNYGVVVPTTE
jgi:hypothetical protein